MRPDHWTLLHWIRPNASLPVLSWWSFQISWEFVWLYFDQKINRTWSHVLDIWFFLMIAHTRCAHSLSRSHTHVTPLVDLRAESIFIVWSKIWISLCVKLQGWANTGLADEQRRWGDITVALACSLLRDLLLVLCWVIFIPSISWNLHS